MDRKLKGYIVLPYYFNSLSEKALEESILLTTVFSSKLALFGIGDDIQYRHELALLTQELLKRGISVESFFTQRKNRDKLLEHFAATHEVILLVQVHDEHKTQAEKSIRKELRKFRKQRIPHVWINHEIPHRDYKDIVITVGFEPMEKEKILWATYFGRRYGSFIHVVLPQVKDSFLKARIEANLQSLHKLYTNLSLPFSIHQTNTGLYSLYTEAVLYADQLQAGCFILLTSPYTFFFERNEDLHLIKKSKNTRILCLNRRDDLYVLCQ